MRNLNNAINSNKSEVANYILRIIRYKYADKNLTETQTLFIFLGSTLVYDYHFWNKWQNKKEYSEFKELLRELFRRISRVFKMKIHAIFLEDSGQFTNEIIDTSGSNMKITFFIDSEDVYVLHSKNCCTNYYPYIIAGWEESLPLDWPSSEILKNYKDFEKMLGMKEKDTKENIEKMTHILISAYKRILINMEDAKKPSINDVENVQPFINNCLGSAGILENLPKPEPEKYRFDYRYNSKINMK